jgi:hypothetical protein
MAAERIDIEMVDTTFLVQFKIPDLGTQPVMAAWAEVKGEHLLLLHCERPIGCRAKKLADSPFNLRGTQHSDISGEILHRAQIPSVTHEAHANLISRGSRMFARRPGEGIHSRLQRLGSWCSGQIFGDHVKVCALLPYTRIKIYFSLHTGVTAHDAPPLLSVPLCGSRQGWVPLERPKAAFSTILIGRFHYLFSFHGLGAGVTQRTDGPNSTETMSTD